MQITLRTAVMLYGQHPYEVGTVILMLAEEIRA